MALAAQSLIPTVSPAAALSAPDATIIDLRSPAEYALDHLPGAHNVPLFDDDERAIVGTLYKRNSPDAAFEAGRELVRGRVDALIGEIFFIARWDLPDADFRARLNQWTSEGIEALDGALLSAPCEQVPDRPVILHCWRGGLRSRSVTSFVRAMGLERAVALEGGYKGYRDWVREGLETWRAPPSFVLRGLTGVGKTLVLDELERQRPGWTCDLEGLARHRGSILGGVDRQPCSQRSFESRLYERLERGFVGPCVFEGESRKVGNSILPERVWSALDGATNLLLSASLARRIEVLTEDYLARTENRAEIAQQLPFLEERLGRVKYAGVLCGLLAQGRDRELVQLLLELYYDPLYRHSEKQREHAVTIDAENPARAATAIAHWIEARLVG
jgi:tRNA 2-selenouridine synthase